MKIYNQLSTSLLIAFMSFFCPAFCENVSPADWDDLVTFSPLPTLHQLPVSAVHTVFKDHEGFIWYGTSDGLCRDDGYDIQVFRNDYRRQFPIKGTTIWCINEDDDGNIWFGTDDGLYEICKPNYNVLSIDSIRYDGVTVKSIFHTSDGDMWVHAYNQLMRYGSDAKYRNTYPLEERNPNKTTQLVESGGTLYLNVPEQGLFYYQQLSDAFLPVPENLNIEMIEDISADNQGTGLWMIDKYKSIYHFKPGNEQHEGHLYAYPLPGDRKGDNYQNIRQDEVYGFLWIRTNQQLMAFTAPASEQEMPCLLWKSQDRLHQNQMLGEMLVKDGDVWSMAFDVASGIYHLAPVAYQHQPFKFLNNRIPYVPAIIALADAGDDWLWVFLERVGLCLVNSKTEQLSRWDEQPELRDYLLGGGTIIARSDHHNGVWVNHYSDNHLEALVRQGSRMQCLADIDLNKYISADRHCVSITEDGHGRLWVGTTGGLLVFDVQSLKLIYCNTRLGEISDICQDEAGQVWVTSLSHGLLRFGSLESYEVILPDRELKSFTLDNSNNCVWLNNDQGELFCLDLATHQVHSHTEECGLNGDRINNLHCDSLGHLWIGMNQRLIEYNPQNHATSNYTTSTRSERMSRLLPRAFAKLNDGQLAYGGIPGLLLVRPSAMLEQQADSIHIAITSITIDGQPRYPTPADDGSLHLQIQAGERDICIAFSSLHHFLAPVTRYGYRIKELGEKWNGTEIGTNKALFSMFPKGRYTMEVRGIDTYGNWTSDVTKLYIEQLPYWYESRWAYLTYAILGLLSIALAFWIAMHNTRKKNEELWADSEEMLLMRQYIQNDGPADPQQSPEQEIEFLQLDKLLLEKAEQAVKQNFSREDFGVQEFAEAMNMSKSTLNRKLKALTDQTPLEYINDYKMKKALVMLKDPDATISEVTIALGFQSRRYFSAVFKKTYNESPTQYQKRVTQK